MAVRVIGLSALAGTPDSNGGDCVSCGRCCHHGPSTVHLLEDDEARMGAALLRRLTLVDERPPHTPSGGWRFMKNEGERCGALDVSVPGRFPCAAYEVRPDDCRIVEPGSPCCLEARRLGHLGSSVEFKRV